MLVRNYKEGDYIQVISLYKDRSTYGGQFDEERDSEIKFGLLSGSNPDKILVAVDHGKIVGTVTLFEDARSAWLFRFAVQGDDEQTICNALYKKGVEVLKKLGHSQILVFAPIANKNFQKRYTKLGMKKGGDYTCYWADI